MRLRIIIDGVPFEIDSADPETLGRWIVEIFGRVTRPNPSTYYEVQAQPSYLPDDSAPHGMRADWIADTRYWSYGRVHTPRELVNLLGKTLDEYEAAK